MPFQAQSFIRSPKLVRRAMDISKYKKYMDKVIFGQVQQGLMFH